ncbi:Nramp family divalent metal transporter [Dyella caseinilytica]|uniref:Divalent metal cation transporter MntH n=1 Tax=Dyella caseinilytica TaxID=1849581 RepID=A0ABX7GT77_9GAMM|nr:Nramp family divalent metal transporter [Dyella caseinilytica]QRN53612.1 Nramp family divalent metal transporter [Dyella caseinilytica]GFZ87892.1 divalent metal cation transporter MntH [Dyella caseinilytica]
MNVRVLDGRLPVTDIAIASMRDALAQRGRGWSTLLKLAGPAVVVSVAYIDPGNFATNIQAGARYGYSLLWVTLVASLVAILFQALSAKLGIVTGRNLAELSREHFPLPLVLSMWVVSEVAAMATDLAEFLGGALGLSLLFHLPLLASMAVTAIATYAVLLLEKRGFRPLEIVVGALVSVIGLCYLAELLITHVQWSGVMEGLFVYQLPDAQAANLAVGIIGATVMPHTLFLHSALTQSRVPARNDIERKKLLKFSNREVGVTLGIAGLINMAMIVMAAGAFHHGHSDVAEIQTAYDTLLPVLGGAAAGLFLLSLMASGLSSSVVGTMAGQMITQGFVRKQLPLWLRRAITMIPSFAVIALGVNATKALVDSQIVLSFALPFPMIALVWLTGHEKLMGAYRSSVGIRVLSIMAVVAVLGLNGMLIAQAVGNT